MGRQEEMWIQFLFSAKNILILKGRITCKRNVKMKVGKEIVRENLKKLKWVLRPNSDKFWALRKLVNEMEKNI